MAAAKGLRASALKVATSAATWMGALLIVVGVGGVGVGAVADAQPSARPRDAASVRRAAESSIDGGYQRDLPGLRAEGADAPMDPTQARDPARNGSPDDGRPRRVVVRERQAPPRQAEPAPALGGLAEILMIGAIVVAVLLLGMYATREFLGEKLDVHDEPKPRRMSAGAAPAEVMLRPLGDADLFATNGNYAEAIHTLLLKTLQELAAASLIQVTPAMTSREILQRAPLLGDAREALAGLITTVELTWFGDDVPAEPDYVRCRQQFQMFAAAYRQGLAR